MPDSISVLFLGANTPWVYALAESLATRGQNVAVIATYDWSNFRRLRPKWPLRERPAGLKRDLWVFPPGYVGALATLCTPFLRSRVDRARSHMASPVDPDGPWVVVAYPWLLPAVANVPDKRLVYYNLDDYALYQPNRSARILRQERDLVNRAAMTLCLAQRQVEALRHRFPVRAESIQHFPLGVVANLVNPDPTRRPESRVVGYIGNLIDRVNWRLVAEVASGLPDVEFRFIGQIDECQSVNSPSGWLGERAAALALPNVRHIDFVAQENVGTCYWNFTVNWMPYATDHAFNRASCPTKIMDGLASGRPLLATDVPECRLYPEWISIVASADQAVIQLSRLLRAASDEAALDIAERQVAFVSRHHIWAHRAESFEQRLALRTVKGD